MRHSIFVCVLFISFFAYSQDNSLLKIEPKPYTVNPYYGDTVAAGIKSIKHIRRKSGLPLDTLTSSFYNRQGVLEKIITYGRGSKTTSIYTRFSKNGVKFVENKQSGTGNDVVLWSYYPDGRIKCVLQYVLAGKDTTFNKRNLYHYNGKKLVGMAASISGRFSGRHEYVYDGDNIVAFRTHTTPEGNKYYRENAYQYSNGVVVAGECRQIMDTVRRMLSNNRFFYDNKDRLVREEYTKMESVEVITTDYKYDKKGNMANFHTTSEKGSLDVSYFYNAIGLCEMKKVSTTSKSSFKELLVMLPQGPATPFPYEFEEKYTYDSKGNIIEIFISDKNGMILQRNYLIEYY